MYMAQILKSKVFWIVIAMIISLSSIGVTLGILLISHNKVSTNLNQLTNSLTYSDTYGSWTYTVSDTEATISKFTGTTEDVMIPSTITNGTDTYTVTALYSASSSSYGVFYSASSTLKSVIIPNTIRIIGNYAFATCSKLSNLSISNGVEYIGNYAFSGCRGLIDIAIPSSITDIGAYAFQYCYGLTSVAMEYGLTYISNYAFAYCNKLTGVTIPNSVTSISDYAFRECTSLKQITIPDNVTYLGQGCFYSCTKLDSAIIGNGITTIYGSTFNKCLGLTIVTIGSNVSSIKTNAFTECYKLLEVVNKSSLGVVAGSQYITGSSELDNLGTYAKHIIYNESQTFYQVIDGVKYYVSGSSEYIAVGSILDKPVDIVINSNCTEILKYAFYSCSTMKNIDIKSTKLTRVGLYSFYNCTNLRYLAIPGGNSCIIDNHSFQGCTSLLNVHLGNGINFLDSATFTGCSSLVIAVLGSGLNKIMSDVFQSCNSLRKVYFLRSYSSIQSSQWLNNNYIDSSNFSSGKTYYFVSQSIRDQARSLYGSGTYEVMDSVILNAIPSYAGTVSGNTNPSNNTNTTLTAEPNSGYMFRYWLKDGKTFSGNTSTSITFKYTTRVAYTAIFDDEYTINVESSNADYGSVTGGGTYINESEIIVTATPNTGYGLLKWLRDGYEFDGNTANPLTITVTWSNTYTAVFDIEYTITAMSVPSGYGTITGGGQYVNGKKQSLVATPNYGYKFVKWQKDGEDFSGNTTTTINIIVAADATYTALFEKESYTITTSVNDSNYGTITLGNTYLYQDEVTLTATSNYGYILTKWQKDGQDFTGNTVNPLSITVTADAEYTAIFEKESYTITTEVNNSNYGTVTSSSTYLYQDEVSLTATPNYGYYFVKWQKDSNDFTGNTTAIINVTVTADATYTAIFDKLSYTITTNVNDSNMGSVTAGDTYLYQTEITITATPNEHYQFDNWLKNGETFTNNTSNPLIIPVTANDTYTAVFSYKRFIITIENFSYNEGSVNIVSGEYQENEQLTLTATPNTGAKFFYWLKDNQVFEHSLDQSFSITVTGSVTYTVFFAPISYIPGMNSPNSIVLEYEYQGAETVNPEVCGMLRFYCYGDFDNMTSVRVEAIATTGYRFVGWKINGVDTISSKYTTATADILLTDIPNSKIIIAVFDKAT